MSKAKEIELLRRQIQARLAQVLNKGGFHFEAELKRFWQFLGGNSRVNDIMLRFSTGHPNIEKIHAPIVMRGMYQETKSEEENLALCYFVVKGCAESDGMNPSSHAGMSFVLDRGITNRLEEGYVQFKENFLKPLINIIDEALQKESFSASENKTLTILKTDMKGFTKRTEEQSRAELVKTVSEHIAQLSSLIEGHNGTNFKTEGDAVLAWFESPTDAILAAIEIQQNIRASTPAGTGNNHVAVRISISSGEVTLKSDGDVLGEAVNIAARLEGGTPAGEIYFTESTRLLMKRSEVSHEHVSDMRFQGVSEVVKVYRVKQ